MSVLLYINMYILRIVNFATEISPYEIINHKNNTFASLL